MGRYRFALRPKWIVSHVFVLLMCFAMINLGFWQIRRLHEKQTHNRHYRERSSAPAVPVSRLMTPASTTADVHRLEFRRVTATGRYRPDQEVLVRGRSQDEAPGSWVLTPLELSDGTAVVVNRGWINDPGLGA